MLRLQQIDKCVECRRVWPPGQENPKWDPIYLEYICDFCRLSDKYEKVYKIYLKDFFLKPNQMEGCEQIHSIVYRHPAVQYRLVDVLDRFCQVYGLDRQDLVAIGRKRAELLAVRAQRSQRVLATKRQNYQNAVQQAIIGRQMREKQLVAALNQYQLELRPDSRLCEGYIDGEITDWTVEAIAQRMCQMRYLFDYCDMERYLDAAYEDQRETRASGHYPDMTIFEQAEMEVMQVIGEFPGIWPWLL